jgi:prepilin-type N-terminal cleavage/methylation domain-containing protein
MARRASQGFTMVELIAVIVITSIIAVVGMARMAAPSPFAVQGVADQLAASLRQAQTLARAQRQAVYVVLSQSPARVQVCLDADCRKPLEGPNGLDNWLDGASRVQLSTSQTLWFDAMGEPNPAEPMQFQVLADGDTVKSALVRLEPVSGYVSQVQP